MIVADTNLIVYLFLPGEHTKSVIKLLEMDNEWVVPYLWRSEFRNVLATYLRQKLIRIEDMFSIMEQAENFLSDSEYEINSSSVLNLLSNSNCSAYDCEYVSLAMDLDIPLVTYDKKMKKQFSEIVITPMEYLS